MPSLAVTVAAVAILAFIVRYAWPTVWSMFTTPLKDLPGPPSASLLWGNLRILADEEDLSVQGQWAAQYGSVISFKGFLGVCIFPFRV